MGRWEQGKYTFFSMVMLITRIEKITFMGSWQNGVWTTDLSEIKQEEAKFFDEKYGEG